ncbi:insoluble domain protein [Rhodococcus sp. SGAir0479]|uniref:insoluble domain protein n=1 Tax=Rhodococcus sp. SGAir0479 TaxID=2567884 RepID=UPI0010CD17C0|nr:insoluble domain protein [Rhodococcus sp. SGAir0479]QCQ94158.1 insoluble domain protein [Rhodococcus sp. SGAir0479]
MGKHRRVSRAAKAGIVPATAAAIVVAGAGIANADPVELPSQGGVTTPAPSTQGGTTAAPQPAYVPEAPSQPTYWVEAPAVQPRYAPKPNYDYQTNQYTQQSNYVAPIDYSALHAPVAVEAAPMYIAPPKTLMIGDYHAEQPNWLTDEDLERTNNTSELIRSQVSTFYRSIGIDADRADRVAAGQIAGTIGGAALGAGIGAVPGALLGGNIGGNAGLAVGGFVSVPLGVIPGLPATVIVPTTVAGTAAGAAIGGAITAVPGAIAGGAVGFTAGTAFGAGDDQGQAIEVDLPSIDPEAITTQAETTLTQWEESGPVGQAAATAVRDVVAAAPGIDQQARDWATAQPGGQQVVDAIDGALTQFGKGSAGVATQMISNAVGDGIQQA